MSSPYLHAQHRASTVWDGYRSVGEIRFLVDWAAAQVARVDWTVSVDGDPLDPDDPTVTSIIDRTAAAVLATNLYVAGTAAYTAVPRGEVAESAAVNLAGDDEMVWVPSAPKAAELGRIRTRQAADLMQALGVWPDPQWPGNAWSPLMSIADVLTEIMLLQQVASAQNRSRINQRGVLVVASEIDLSTDAIREHLERPIHDPERTGADAIIMRAPLDLMDRDSFQWVTPPQSDTRTDDRIRFAVQRAVWGFPLPPEILMGMTATNRATAFQIEHQTYSAYLAEPARLVGQIFAAAARLVLDRPDVTVTPDPGPLFERHATVQDIQWAWPAGLVSAETVRGVLGLDDDDAAGDDDLEILARAAAGAAGPGEAPTDQPDPSITAAAHAGTVDLDALADELADIDDAASRETIVDAAAAASRAMERLGARIRTRVRTDTASTAKIDGVPNDRVPSVIDETTAALDYRAELISDLEAFAVRWQERWTVADEDTRQVIGQVAAPPEPVDPAMLAAAAETVTAQLADWALTDRAADDDTPPARVVLPPDSTWSPMGGI